MYKHLSSFPAIASEKSSLLFGQTYGRGQSGMNHCSKISFTTSSRRVSYVSSTGNVISARTISVRGRRPYLSTNKCFAGSRRNVILGRADNPIEYGGKIELLHRSFYPPTWERSARCSKCLQTFLNATNPHGDVAKPEELATDLLAKEVDAKSSVGLPECLLGCLSKARQHSILLEVCQQWLTDGSFSWVSTENLDFVLRSAVVYPATGLLVLERCIKIALSKGIVLRPAALHQSFTKFLGLRDVDAAKAFIRTLKQLLDHDYIYLEPFVPLAAASAPSRLIAKSAWDLLPAERCVEVTLRTLERKGATQPLHWTRNMTNYLYANHQVVPFHVRSVFAHCLQQNFRALDAQTFATTSERDFKSICEYVNCSHIFEELGRGNRVLAVHKRFELLRLLGFLRVKPRNDVQTLAMVRSFCICGMFEKAERLVDEGARSHPNSVQAFLNVLLTGYRSHERYDKMSDVLKRMEKMGMPATLQTYHEMLLAQVSNMDFEGASTVAKQILASGYHLTDRLLAELLLKLKNVGATSLIDPILEEFSKGDVQAYSYSYHAALKAHASVLAADRAEQLLAHLELAKAPCLRQSYQEMMLLYSRLGDIKQIDRFFRVLQNNGYEVEAYEGYATYFLTRGHLERAKEVLDEMNAKGFKFGGMMYSNLVRSHLKYGELATAEEFLKEAHHKGVGVSTALYGRLIVGYAAERKDRKLLTLLSKLPQQGFVLPVNTYALVIEELLKRRNLTTANKVVEIFIRHRGRPVPYFVIEPIHRHLISIQKNGPADKLLADCKG